MTFLPDSILKPAKRAASRFVNEADPEMQASVTIRWKDSAGEHTYVFAKPRIVDRNKLEVVKS